MTTTYFLNCVMGNVFHTKTDPALPTTYYVALSSTAPSVDGTGVTEPPENVGYERIAITSLGEPENGVIKNVEDIDFPESTGNWGTITHYAVLDAPVAGNLLFYNALEKSRIVQADNQVRFKAGSMTITLESAT